MRSTTTLLLLVLLLARSAWAQDAGHTLEFIENRGQWDARARYAAQVAPGARLFVESTGPDLRPHRRAARPRRRTRRPRGTRPSNQVRAHGLRVEFVRPDPAAALRPEAETDAPGPPLPARRRPARWAAGVRAWHGLRYRQLWPGIDLVLQENARQQLEYDLLLAAGADPARPACATRAPKACTSTPPPATCW